MSDRWDIPFLKFWGNLTSLDARLNTSLTSDCYLALIFTICTHSWTSCTLKTMDCFCKIMPRVLSDLSCPELVLGTFLSNLPTPTFAWHETNEVYTELSGEVCSHAWSCTCRYRKAVVSYRIGMAYHPSRWFVNTCGIDVTLSYYTSPT